MGVEPVNCLFEGVANVEATGTGRTIDQVLGMGSMVENLGKVGLEKVEVAGHGARGVSLLDFDRGWLPPQPPLTKGGAFRLGSGSLPLSKGRAGVGYITLAIGSPSGRSSQ